jgi:AcrR family transcriptional regulator
MVEAGELNQLTLRGIARRVGVAATSLYLHFPDVDRLLGEVVRRAFAALGQATTEAAEGITDPELELRARCLAYCRFGLEHHHLYRLMFEARIPSSVSADPEQTPGRQSFDQLVSAVRRCLERRGRAEDAFRVASLIWAGEHGLVMARLSRPMFPWPTLEEMVEELVSRLIG